MKSKAARRWSSFYLISWNLLFAFAGSKRPTSTPVIPADSGNMILENEFKITPTSERNQSAILPEPHKGRRLAVTVSTVTFLLIIAVLASFTMCCVRERHLSVEEEAACFGYPDQGHQPGSAREEDDERRDENLQPSSLLSSASFSGSRGSDAGAFNRPHAAFQEIHACPGIHRQPL